MTDKKKRVLWVEDDAIILWDLITPLIRMGWEIDSALDFESAINKIRGGAPYDLIILDIIIPSGSMFYSSITEISKIDNTQFGVKFLEFLKDKEKIPVVVFSVVTDPVILDQVRKFPNVEDIIIKGSVRPSELKARLISIGNGEKGS